MRSSWIETAPEARKPLDNVDASAAIGVAQRVGLGKLRHLDVQSLWLQQSVKRKQLGLSKVPRTLTPADLMTKYTEAATIGRLMRIMNLERRESRAEVSPHISQ